METAPSNVANREGRCSESVWGEGVFAPQEKEAMGTICLRRSGRISRDGLLSELSSGP